MTWKFFGNKEREGGGFREKDNSLNCTINFISFFLLLLLAVVAIDFVDNISHFEGNFGTFSSSSSLELNYQKKKKISFLSFRDPFSKIIS